MYHLHIKIIGGGRSIVAVAAYRAGEKLRDEANEKTQDYTHRKDVEYSNILLPDGAPERYRDRKTLWNAVAEAEKKSKKPQYAREVEVAFPLEMSRQQRIEALENYIRENYTARGMIADYSIHDKKGNPHAHILLTMRKLKENGEFDAKRRDVYVLDENGERIPELNKSGEQKRDKKGARVWKRERVDVTDWNDPAHAEEWRAAWATECNKYLDQDHRIDHRSYERRGISDKLATIHEGAAAREIEKRGKISDRCQLNREIQALNEARRIVEQEEINIRVAMRRAELDEAVKQYHAELQQIRTWRASYYDTNKDRAKNRGRGARRAQKRSGAKTSLYRARQSYFNNFGRDQRRSFAELGQPRHLQDVSFFGVVEETARDRLLLPSDERDHVLIGEAERVRNIGVQRTSAAAAGRAGGIDERLEALRKRVDTISTLKKEKMEEHNMSENNDTTKTRLDALSARVGEITEKRKKDLEQAKEIIKSPSAVAAPVFLNAYKIVLKAAMAGDRSAQAFLVDNGKRIPDSWKKDWEHMTVAERDYELWKRAIRDDYGDEEEWENRPFMQMTDEERRQQLLDFWEKQNAEAKKAQRAVTKDLQKAAKVATRVLTKGVPVR